LEVGIVPLPLIYGVSFGNFDVSFGNFDVT
jgi:hypothetical protein